MKKIAIIACSRSGHNFIMDQIKSWGEYRLINRENAMVDELYHEKYGDIEHGDINIVVVRDFKNWLASYIKFVPYNDNVHTVIKIWENHALEVSGRTNHINGIPILYSRFMQDRDYRVSLCDKLGGEYSESRIDTVPFPGGGSSFDGVKIKGRKLDTGNRWKQILDSEYSDIYKDLLKINANLLDFCF